MIEKFISPGDKLEMKSTTDVKLPDGSQGVRLYKSTVYDVLDDGRIEIVMPYGAEQACSAPGLMENTRSASSHMEACIVQMYVFLDRDKINNTYVLIAEMITNLHKFQRREYYRFNCVIEMKMRELNKAEVEAFSKNLGYLISEADMLRGVIVDISGGGLRFVSRTPYRQGTVLYLKYKLEIADKEKEFNMAAMVLSSEQIPNRADEYQNRVKFLNMNTTTREDIIKYIFNEERKNRKNGKG